MGVLEKKSAFSKEQMLSWLSYFAKKTALDIETVRLVDMSGKNKNLIPAVESNRYVLAFADASRPTLFYDMWNAGLGDCSVWIKTDPQPEGDIVCEKISGCIDREITGPTVLLVDNPRSDSAYKIGLQNQRFSKGSVRYVAHEIRAVIMSMLEVRAEDTICIISGESIAVEAAMSACDGTIIAVEYDASDRASMEENVSKFGLNNVQIVPDAKLETLEAAPVPSTAFIVATDHLEEEMKALLQRNPNIRFVIYTLELNILAKIPALFEKYAIHDMEALQISVSKLRRSGMFETKPVPWIISGLAGAQEA